MLKHTPLSHFLFHPKMSIILPFNYLYTSLPYFIFYIYLTYYLFNTLYILHTFLHIFPGGLGTNIQYFIFHYLYIHFIFTSYLFTFKFQHLPLFTLLKFTKFNIYIILKYLFNKIRPKYIYPPPFHLVLRL